jgi:hypothetical protein
MKLEDFKFLEETRHSLLEEEEQTWSLRSRALWLQDGDNKNQFFHQFDNFRKNPNTIWEIENEEGYLVRSFEAKYDAEDNFSKIFSNPW